MNAIKQNFFHLRNFNGKHNIKNYLKGNMKKTTLPPNGKKFVPDLSFFKKKLS